MPGTNTGNLKSNPPKAPESKNVGVRGIVPQPTMPQPKKGK